MKTYITTPIYYVNDVPHIGHAYTTIISDSIARYARLKGNDTFFLTGTDEHGQKIELAAKQRNKKPKEYADEISAKFKELWDDFEISYNHFIRTTDEKHQITVQKAFEIMQKNGDIYKDEYEGHYCVSCETFFSESQLLDKIGCPDCGRETTLLKEESYFFKLSKYEDKLLQWYEQNPKCVMPNHKKNEVISFVKSGLKDLSITRTSFDWGIKLPKSSNDEKHVMYVWLDALMNYLSALGYLQEDEDMDFWPATFHLVGKDILRFHAIYWPAFLMSLNLPLPKHIAAHGWWTRNGEKMSKSKGNVVNPKEVADAYGLENFRYFLLREVPFGQDGDFSQKALIDRINSDLANEYGNLLNRIIGMSGKYSDFKISSKNVKTYHEKELIELKNYLDEATFYLEDMQPNKYLESLWKALSLANLSITKYEPWNLIKQNKLNEALALVALVANIIAKVSILLNPVMPKTTTKVANSLNFDINNQTYEKLITNENLLNDFTIKQIPPLFPRVEKELMKSIEVKVEKKQTSNQIDINEFFKSQIKIGTIIEAREVEESDRLLCLIVDLGEQKPRQIISGIKKYYNVSELINKQVCVVANLKEATIMKLKSEGMILTAQDKKSLKLLSVDAFIKNGTDVK